MRRKEGGGGEERSKREREEGGEGGEDIVSGLLLRDHFLLSPHALFAVCSFFLTSILAHLATQIALVPYSKFSPLGPRPETTRSFRVLSIPRSTTKTEDDAMSSLTHTYETGGPESEEVLNECDGKTDGAGEDRMGYTGVVIPE